MIPVLAFIRNNWQALAFIAIAGVIFMRIEILKSERDDALATIAGMQQEALKRNTEVLVSDTLGKQAVERLENQYKSKINELLEVNSHDQKTISNLRADLTARLRKQSESYNNQLPSNVANQSAGNYSDTVHAGQGENFYRQAYLGAIDYIHTLEQAGAVCAADYNFCRDYVISEQNRIGVISE